MSDCGEWFEELTHEATVVLDEDLAALQRMPERTRIERYNDVKAGEEAFLWEFREECPDFLTDGERDRVRGEFRLARLLLAASFYADGSVPRALADDFVEAELQAVVDFDRYKQFDALTEDQIEARIRRMDGEVYELVEEYTSTQIANVDALVDDPDVQQDLIERLVERYDDRREKIRHGFFVYVETHGLEHMVEAIEEAVTAVNEAAAEREAVREELDAQLADVAETIDDRLDRQYREIESELTRLEGELASRTVDPETVRSELERVVGDRLEGGTDGADGEDLDARIRRTSELEGRIEMRIDDLEGARASAVEEATAEMREEAVALVEAELDELRAQREELRREVSGLEREREQIEAARDEVERSLGGGTDGGGAGVDGEHAVTATMARVLELDYLGRFDISMRETGAVHTPEGAFEVPEGYWDGRSERRSERARLFSLLDGEDPEEYPTNAMARYEITSSRYLGLGSETEMVVEARVLSDLEAFARNGFDASPATLDDLLAVVNEVVYEAEGDDHAYLLGVASPTGWSDRVREQVEAEAFARSRFSKHVSVCLVDLQDGSLVYDDADPVASENADLFAPPVDAERVEECVETVRREYVDDVTTESVRLADVADAHGYRDHVVKRAFNRLEEAGAGEQLYVDELGLTLQCGT